MHEHASLDLAYVQRCSLALDLQILLQTVPAVFGRRPRRLTREVVCAGLLGRLNGRHPGHDGWTAAP